MTKSTRSTMSKLEFVEYTGRYPNLCSGRLFVRIDGKLVSFGDYCLGKRGETSDDDVPNYPKFWEPGGHIWMDDEGDMGAAKGPWLMSVHDYDKDKFPPEIIELLPELVKLFSEEVAPPCCGGCI